MANKSLIGVAIFGLGRAGTIHLLNLIRNPRVSVLYIVEQEIIKAEQAVDTYRLSETEKLTVEQASRAYEDPRQVYEEVTSKVFFIVLLVKTFLGQFRVQFLTQFSPSE